MGSQVQPIEETNTDSIKLPKNTKTIRYYYRNRDEILEKYRLKKLEDPEYQAKLKARENTKKAKEEARKAKEEARKAKEEARKAKEETKEELAKKKAILLGALTEK